jgi:hypothetical protein
MLLLHKYFIKMDQEKSGICHHMIFEKKYINEIISIIEHTHHDLFYNVFLKMVIDKAGSGASEYELYFNYMIKNHKDKIKIRPLKWKNTNDILKIDNYNNDYVSWHWYMRSYK